jgi:hypothetical protein
MERTSAEFWFTNKSFRFGGATQTITQGE